MLKGKTIIELTNVKTGEKERYEHDNLITNTAEQILKLYQRFASCPSGLITGLYSKLFGGVLLLNRAQTESPATVYPTANTKLTGCAVLGAQNTGAYAQLGSANIIETEITETVAKFVYDFATSQANGTIACVALTPQFCGAIPFDGEVPMPNPSAVLAGTGHAISTYNAGIGTWPGMGTGLFEDLNQFGHLGCNEGTTVMTESTAGIRRNVTYTMYWDLDANKLKAFKIETANGTLTLQEIHGRLTGEYAFNTNVTGKIADGTTITLQDFNSDTATYWVQYCVDIPNKRLYILQNTALYSSYNSIWPINQPINVWEIDLTTEAVTKYSVMNTTGMRLALLGFMQNNYNSRCPENLIIHNRYLYIGSTYAESSTPHVYKIDITNGTNVTEIDLSAFTGMSPAYYYGSNMPGTNSVGGFPWLGNTNGGVMCRFLYALGNRLYFGPGGNYYSNWAVGRVICINVETGKMEVTGLCVAPQYSNGVLRTNYPGINLNIESSQWTMRVAPPIGMITTVNNLQSPVLKTADKTMKLTYILTEVQS